MPQVLASISPNIDIQSVLVLGHRFYIWGSYANCAKCRPVFKTVGLYFSQAIIHVNEYPSSREKTGWIAVRSGWPSVDEAAW
jgi:hypothetical protein